MKTLLSTFLIIILFFLSNIPIFCQEARQQNRDTVYVITLQGEIFDGLARRVSKKFKRIDVNRAKAIILEIDTPGGGVGYVLDLCKQIDALASANVPVYAYITGFAWSGGALLSLACDRIYMVEQSSIGSAQVKIMTPFGVKDADEKTMSAMRAHFRAYAEHRNYPKVLAEAMVDASIEATEVIYRGERFFKSRDELNKMLEDLSQERDAISHRTIKPAGKLANFTAKEAKEYGFCRAILQTREAVLQETGLKEMKLIELTTTAEDSLANILTTDWVKILLISLGILGILIEFWTPTFGIPGIFGIACLSLAFVGAYLAETAALWEILIFLAGLILIALEIFVIPGTGVAGILGIIACFVGLLLSMQTFILPESEEQTNLLMINIFNLTLSIGLDILSLFLITRFLPESAPLRRLSIATVQLPEEGYSVAIPSFQNLVGKEGVALNTLRPAGRIKIEKEEYDVISQGDFLEPGTKVKVVEIQGNRIIVNKI